MFKHRVNGASRYRVNRASSACVACPDGSPLRYNIVLQHCKVVVICCLYNNTINGRENRSNNYLGQQMSVARRYSNETK